MHSKKLAAFGIVVFLFALKSIHGQSTFSIRLDAQLFDLCQRYAYSTEVKVRINNLTDASDTKLFSLYCELKGQTSSQNSISREVKAPSLRRPLQLLTSWTDSQNWQITVTDQWIAINGLSLPHQSYKLSAVWNQVFHQEKQLLEQPFMVDAVNGSTIHEFVIEDRGLLRLLRDKYLGRQTAYISLILLLTGLLGVAIRKRVEKGIDQLLDQLGAYTKGKLAARRFLRRYSDFLLTGHKYLRLIGFGAAGISRPLLEEVFISLRVSAFDPKKNFMEPAENSDISFETAVSRFSKLVILGGPGAGKTTVLSYITLQCLASQGTSLFGFSAHYLPLYIPLRRLSNRETSLLDDLLSTETQILPADLLKECPSGFLKRELERGRCIVLLDGLDEVLDETAHRMAAEKINRMVSDFPKSRFIVTCRVAGWRGLLDEFAVLEARDLNRTEVHRFIFGWHRAVIRQEFRNQIELKFKDAKERDEAWQQQRGEIRNVIDTTSRRLLGSIEANARLLAIARNPMLLSLICLVHYVKNILPRERPILYEKCVELLIDAWDRSRNIVSLVSNIDSYQKEAVLRAVAMAFQTTGRGEAPRHEVEAIVAAEAKKLNLPIGGKELVQQMEQRSGILIERSIDVLGFSHLTLQEYLVAKHIQLNAGETALLKANFDSEQWREVILLYAGLIDDATSLIESIVGLKTPHRWLLAGYTLGEARRVERSLAEAVIEQLIVRFESAQDADEASLNVMAAVAADYADQPLLPEQVFSATLIEHIRTRDVCASQAVRVLGKARITKALPFIVECLGERDPKLLADVRDSIVFFGNTAMPYIKSYIHRENVKLQISQVISLLQAVDTAEAGKLLIECYDIWRGQGDHLLISLALAEMLASETVESELLTLKDSDISTIIPMSFASEDIIWPYESSASRGYVRLCLKIRDDIGSAMAEPFHIDLEKVSFKVAFPALVKLLKLSQIKISKDRWQEFGFASALDGRAAVLERIHKELRTGSIPVNESIRRVTRRRSSVSEIPKIVRVLRWPAEIALSSFTLLDGFFVAISVGVLLSDSTIPGNLGFATIASFACLRFLLCSIYAARIVGRGRRRIGLINSTPTILRRTPYLTTFRPWLNFVFVQLVIGLLSFPGVFLTFLVQEIAQGGIIDAKLFTDVFLLYLVFLLTAVWFYKYQALNFDATALLLMQHPRGRESLGLPREIGILESTQAPGPVREPALSAASGV